MAFNGRVESDFLKLSEFPQANKSATIDFAATDFESLRNSLITYIKLVYPNDYQNFVESDLGVMLIELVSYMGAVMSMKADMLAHENYISTAKNRNNVAKLLQLIGVKLKGPISAMASAKLTLDIPSTTETVTFGPQNRVMTVNSPEDGALVSYTLYKTTNGYIDALDNSTANLDLSVNDVGCTASSVWTNLALLEGTFVTETGTINDNLTSKVISLSNYPVIEKSVNVYFNTANTAVSGTWTEVDNLYYVSDGEQNVFEVIYTDNYGAIVLFGDGVTGRAVPNNTPYTIVYRIGGGSRGNIGDEVINFPVTDSNGQTGIIENTSVGSGGQDAETVEQAKNYAPLIFKTQDRLVTAQDYAAFANRFAAETGATGKARAVVRDAYSSANIIDLYLLQVASNIQLQQATVEFKKQLLEAIESKKMITDEVVIVDGVIRTLDLVITVRVDQYNLGNEEQIKAKARRSILSFFNVNNTDFGKPFIPSELVRELIKTPEIRFATVDNLDDVVSVDFNEIIQLNNFTLNIVGI